MPNSIAISSPTDSKKRVRRFIPSGPTTTVVLILVIGATGVWFANRGREPLWQSLAVVSTGWLIGVLLLPYIKRFLKR